MNYEGVIIVNIKENTLFNYFTNVNYSFIITQFNSFDDGHLWFRGLQTVTEFSKVKRWQKLKKIAICHIIICFSISKTNKTINRKIVMGFKKNGGTVSTTFFGWKVWTYYVAWYFDRRKMIYTLIYYREKVKEQLIFCSC